MGMCSKPKFNAKTEQEKTGSGDKNKYGIFSCNRLVLIIGAKITVSALNQIKQNIFTLFLFTIFGALFVKRFILPLPAKW